jgi:hypothetical protein
MLESVLSILPGLTHQPSTITLSELDTVMIPTVYVNKLRC